MHLTVRGLYMGWGHYGPRRGRNVICPTCEAAIGRPCRTTRGPHRGERMHGTHTPRLDAKPVQALADAVPPRELQELQRRMLLAARLYGEATRGELARTIRDLERNAARWAIGLGRAGRAAAAR